METAVNQAVRLLASLDELSGQEGMYLRNGHYDLAAGIRQRAGALVTRLVELAGQPGVSELRPRVMAQVERCERHAAFLREKLQEVAREIRRTDQARFRTAQVAPAYAQPAGTAAPRFEAAG